MFLSGEKVEGEKVHISSGSSVKGSSQQSSTSGPEVKGGGPLFSGQGPLIMGGLVNDTTPISFADSRLNYHPQWCLSVHMGVCITGARSLSGGGYAWLQVPSGG